ncbi:MAG: DNA-binding response regulator [Sulfurospirillum sp.]|nr:MAG: DNA-binding response regulator [Sulfurospirillum sp.]
MNILLLEDELGLRESITEYLEDSGFMVDAFEGGEEALDAIYENKYQLFLLDVQVPGLNGFELLSQLRKSGDRTPAIFITSLTNIENLSKGFEIGCSDYIKKPFELKELEIRLAHALKKECLHTDDALIVLSDRYRYDAKNFLLLEHDREIALSKTEKRILETLIKHRGSVVSIEQFQDEVWGEYMDPANIRVQINKLRKKMDDDIIHNIRGLGYKIDA